MADYIDRQAAIDLLNKWADGYRYIEVETEYAINQFMAIPSNEIMIGGYPARHLAFIATIMNREGFSPEEVGACLRDIDRMVGMIMAEQKEIIEKTLKEWGSV